MEANYEEVMNFGKRSLWGLLRTSLRSALFPPLTPFLRNPCFAFSISQSRRKSRTYCFAVGIHELSMAAGGKEPGE